MTVDTFNAAMNQLFASHNRKHDQELLDAYWKALRWLDDDAFRYAVDRSLTEDETFPKIPKLRSYGKEVQKKKSTELIRFSFYHDACDLSFSVLVDDLRPTKYFICQACEFYHHQKIQWNGAFLKTKMEEAQKGGGEIAYL